MTHIGIVIGWKFNHQQGMTTIDGVITEFPGGIPSQADQDKWTAEYLVQFPKGYDEWKDKMYDSDRSTMPRYLEDLITDKFAGDAGTSLQERYDKKIKIRGERP